MLTEGQVIPGTWNIRAREWMFSRLMFSRCFDPYLHPSPGASVYSRQRDRPEDSYSDPPYLCPECLSDNVFAYIDKNSRPIISCWYCADCHTSWTFEAAGCLSCGRPIEYNPELKEWRCFHCAITWEEAVIKRAYELGDERAFRE